MKFVVPFLLKSRGKKHGLVPKRITVIRAGKTFQTTVWVRPEEGKGSVQYDLSEQSSPKPTVPVEAESLAKAENAIGNLDYEKCYVFDSEGKVLYTKSGERNRIMFGGDELNKIERAAVFTHNHPKGGSFSPEDLRLAYVQKIREMRVVGSVFSYSAKIEPNWNLDDWNNLVAKLADAESYTIEKFWKRINAREMTTEEAESLHWHTIWTNVSKSVEGFEYKRIRRAK